MTDESAAAGSIPDGVQSRRVRTERLDTQLLCCGPAAAEPVLLVHGNISTSVFWRQTMLDLAPARRSYAPDLRGFGDSEPLGVDATRGLADYADDLASLLDTLGTGPVHIVGWSMGGGICWTMLRDRPDLLRSLVLVNPVSPYGYGGSIDAAGTLAFEDNAGCGAGAVNPEFVQRLRDGDRGADSGASPRNVMNATYFRPPFRAADEDAYVEAMLSTRIGEDHYPGDAATSANWPGVRPGARGVLNSMSREHLALDPVLQKGLSTPVLWVRGSHDVIVADAAALDLANLGKLGVVPGWPGDDVGPPQPMVAQTRHFLDAYAAAGGSCKEVVIDGTGHSPHVEKPAEFSRVLGAFLDGHAPR